MHSVIEHDETEMLTAEKEMIPARKQKRKINKSFIYIAIFLVIGGLIAVCVYLFYDTLTVGTAATNSAFQAEKETSSEEAYDWFYNKSYTAAEASHHVSNDVSITIGSLREEAKLEVLNVSNIEYTIFSNENEGTSRQSFWDFVTADEDDLVSWFAIPGNGVFTVDLRTAEFIIDEERAYVLLRIPRPELTEFTIDFANVEILYFEDSGLFKNSAKAGVDLALEALQDAEQTLREEILSDQRFYQAAYDNAVSLLTCLIMELNPDFSNLTVDVEFIN